ncbi:EcoKI restriction-modification system protein HsdS [Novipirellula galeiformis]|uniref:EcoKI restriction-modification system protein HsdS n=1 Tax=Novipirellula galeiformis TaxID=2528004 RepID=A0A5C6CKH8_9BACT|nr:restriction endonuclease subunit S [Novipirellula galeiformis]TWU25100.1 EcoKI restriction-modification system protein HsdS [Novipirellula galeiformis]
MSNPTVGESPDHWEFTTLGEVCDRGGGSIQTGPFGSQLHASDYVDEGIPSIMPVNIGDNRLIETDIKRITEEDAERLSKHLVVPGDIIYSRRGDVERRALVREEQRGWFCGTGCIKVRLGEGVVDPAFASFYLDHPNVRQWIVQHAVGATMPNLNTSIMKAIPFVLPPPEEQRAIASILGSLDDKIELNRRMNATLESLARAIFKSWFVDFDPVKINAGQMPADGHDPTILNLFPSTFQDSGIPEGWVSTTLGDEVDFQTGNAFKSKSFTNEPPGTRLARGMNVKEGVFFWGNQTRYWPEVTDDIEPYLLRAGDVLIGMDGSKVGKNWVRVREVDLPCLLVQRVARLRAADSVGENFLWILCGSETFRRYVDSVKTGTSIPHISGGQIKSLSFVRPPKGDDRVFHEFENIVSAFANQHDKNASESVSLSLLRDTLLPRLLSGERPVPDSLLPIEQVV